MKKNMGSALALYPSPVMMECNVDDIYQTKGFESLFYKSDQTYYEYLHTGDVIGKCMSLDQEEKHE